MRGLLVLIIILWALLGAVAHYTLSQRMIVVLVLSLLLAQAIIFFCLILNQGGRTHGRGPWGQRIRRYREDWRR